MSTIVIIYLVGFIIILGLGFLARFYAKRQGDDLRFNPRTVGLP